MKFNCFWPHLIALLLHVGNGRLGACSLGLKQSLKLFPLLFDGCLCTLSAQCCREEELSGVWSCSVEIEF